MDRALKANGRIFKQINHRPSAVDQWLKAGKEVVNGDILKECNDGWFICERLNCRVNILAIDDREKYYEELVDSETKAATSEDINNDGDSSGASKPVLNVDFYAKSDCWQGLVVRNSKCGGCGVAVSKDGAIGLANDIYANFGSKWMDFDDNFDFSKFEHDELFWVAFESRGLWYAICKINPDEECFELVVELEPSMWYTSKAIMYVKKVDKPFVFTH